MISIDQLYKFLLELIVIYINSMVEVKTGPKSHPIRDPKGHSSSKDDGCVPKKSV